MKKLILSLKYAVLNSIGYILALNLVITVMTMVRGFEDHIHEVAVRLFVVFLVTAAVIIFIALIYAYFNFEEIHEGAQNNNKSKLN